VEGWTEKQVNQIKEKELSKWMNFYHYIVWV
jgi:hypothetical protein